MRSVGDQRGGVGHESLEHGGALCFVVGFMSRQPHQWGQGAQQRNPACDQSGSDSIAHGRDHTAPEVWGAIQADRFLLDQCRDRMDMPATKEAVRRMSQRKQHQACEIPCVLR
jgi:hypothetical protein